MDQLKDEATENVVIGSLILNPKEYNAVAHYVTDLNVFSQQRARILETPERAGDQVSDLRLRYL